MKVYLGLLLNWINYYTFLYFMCCHNLIKTKVYYSMLWHSIYCIPFKFAYWKNSVFMLLATWRCCSPAWPLLNEKRTGGKKSRVKDGGVPEHTHRLRNRHGPMVAMVAPKQRCLGAKTNSPESSLWWAVSNCRNELKMNFVSAWFCSKWRHISLFFDFIWSISGPWVIDLKVRL